MHLLRTLSLALLAMTLTTTAHAQARAKSKADEATMVWRYEIRPVGVGAQGTSLIEVSAYSKKVAVAAEQTKKNAVHGILFKGYGGMAGIPGRSPLIKDPAFAVNNSGFMEEFFKPGGDYMRFIGQASEDVRSTDVGKEFKVEVVVTVLVDELRKYMEATGHIKSATSGF